MLLLGTSAKASMAASNIKATITFKNRHIKEQAPHQTQMHSDSREAERARVRFAKVKVKRRQAFGKATYMAVEQRASLTG